MTHGYWLEYQGKLFLVAKKIAGHSEVSQIFLITVWLYNFKLKQLQMKTLIVTFYTFHYHNVLGFVTFLAILSIVHSFYIIIFCINNCLILKSKMLSELPKPQDQWCYHNFHYKDYYMYNVHTIACDLKSSVQRVYFLVPRPPAGAAIVVAIHLSSVRPSGKFQL